MPAFELNNTHNTREQRGTAGVTNPIQTSEEMVLDVKKLKEECIVALKVYDSCRQQDCLTLGPARCEKKNQIIEPPLDADSVFIKDQEVRVNAEITNVRPSVLKGAGFWDITVRFTFSYTLVFEEVDGTEICEIEAVSSFVKKVTLFGSTGGDVVVVSTFPGLHDLKEEEKPYVLVEAKAFALGAEIRYQAGEPCDCDHNGGSLEPSHVDVIIGLFVIIKVLRLVNLSVQSKGFCIPDECPEVEALHPCDVFDDMDFPVDLFAPPQKPEFLAGISGNIPSGKGKGKGKDKDGDCGCL